MFWLQRKRLRAFIKNALWAFPVLSMAAAMACAPLFRYLNEKLQVRFLDFGLQGARAGVAMIAASMLTFVVFFFSVLLLTVQIASGSLSPRIIGRPFQSSALKLSLGLFVFTFVYGTSVLGRLEEQVLQLSVFLTLLLTILSIGVFLFIVEYIGKELRPVTVVTKVAREGLSVIESVYPHPWTSASAGGLGFATFRKRYNDRSVNHTGRPGVVVAFDLGGLAALAERHRCVIGLVPQGGDFVPAGAPLFRVYGDGGTIRDGELRGSIALGAERTLEQ